MTTPPSMDHNAVQSAANEPSKTRDLDPNVTQFQASNPDASVWVSASAGTGKTKVLTDRVLRLLLPGQDGQPGTAPHKILCLTFTKAAASEMSLRISEILGEWAVADDAALSKKLEKLLRRAPKAFEIEAARRLFAEVTDVPGGLKIMTIHAFCQSILGRFPLEAGVSPTFEALDEAESARLITQARDTALNVAAADPHSPLGKATENLVKTISEDTFSSLLGDIMSERHQMRALLKRNFGIDGLYTALCNALNITPGTSENELLYASMQNTAFEKQALLDVARIMASSAKKTDQGNAEKILSFLQANTKERETLFNEYQDAFLTKDKTIRAKLITKDCAAQNPQAQDVLLGEAERLLTLNETIKAVQTANFTRDLFTLGYAVLEAYDSIKNQQSVLDFDDLILKTLALLNGETSNFKAENAAGWIHYKLDQGLDHILVDEAQDTNPEQWKIIENLCSDFFSGTSYKETGRSVFIVGDEKQSIYSFQRASPEAFSALQSYFADKIQDAGMQWARLPMNISFRTVPAILSAVDSVFSFADAKAGLGDDTVTHHSFHTRAGQEGHCELWPLFENDVTEPVDLWTPVVEEQIAQTGTKKLASHIAVTIQQWIDQKHILQSHDRPIKPGDIMILVRTRGQIVSHITRELKNLNIPVSGLDRIILTDQIAIQDMISAAEFSLQTASDLHLASLLKSPLFGLSEDDVFEYAHGRGDISLWDSVQNKADNTLISHLQNLVAKTVQCGPFEFFLSLLAEPCFSNKNSGKQAMLGRLGHDCVDPLDELLRIAMDFEKNNPPSLQLFLQFIKEQDLEIKREQDTQSGQVRIMTVHASKGLQAPIVILPDTTGINTSAGKGDKRLIWPHQSNVDIPLWSPRKENDTALYKTAMDTLNTKLEEEYRRLLYVAMTRAEDRLYIGGALGKKAMNERCWYSLVERGLIALNGHKNLDDGRIIYTNPQIKDPDRQKEEDIKAAHTAQLPAWVHQNAENEESTAIIRPSILDDRALSPLQTLTHDRFLRGNLTHKLLQILPSLPQEQRESAAKRFIGQFGTALDKTAQQGIIDETMAILSDSEFKELFGPDSQAEVPISAFLDGQGMISGQIDRLRITDKTIYIIDYKTNRPPPQDPENIPEAYINQMQIYASVLREIYPERDIKAALLWTDGPSLMSVPLKD